VKPDTTGSVCAIVVTYNRMELLRTCLAAIYHQQQRPDHVYVVDNHSTDGTAEMLAELAGFSLGSEEVGRALEREGVYGEAGTAGLPLSYIRLLENSGGAGGFSAGIRKGFAEGHEWLWLMDDDGVPEAECLAQLLSVGSEHIPYVAPDLIDSNGQSHFPWWGRSAGDLVANRGGPFNGVLLNRRVVKAVGYPMANFFIWGDENEYLDRIENAGIVVTTYRKARHGHKRTSIDFRRNRRAFYLVRNTVFRARLYDGMAGSRKLFILWCLYMIVRNMMLFFLHANVRQGCSCIRGLWRGAREDLNRQKRVSCWGGIPSAPADSIVVQGCQTRCR